MFAHFKINYGVFNFHIFSETKELQDLFKKCTSVHTIVRELDRLILRIEVI